MEKGSLHDFLWGGGIVRGGVQSTAPSKNPPPFHLASNFSKIYWEIETGNETSTILNSRININNRELGLINDKNHQELSSYGIVIQNALQYFDNIYDENAATLYLKINTEIFKK